MGSFKKVAFVVFLISFVIFCALFGGLPRLRKTPVGMINRLLWIKLPSLLIGLDQLVTGGRCIRILKRSGHYLMNENHPIILVLYLALLVACQATFIPPVHAVLPWSLRIPMYPLALLPYYFTFLSATSTASFITPASLPSQMREYPYDRVLFRSAQFCNTCQILKPARSKHCRLCKRCVHRLDHHCIWVRNCLGRENYFHFLAMLLSLAAMLAYGAYVGFHLLDGTIQDATDAARPEVTVSSGEEWIRGPRWSKGLTWSNWFDRWTWAFAAHIRVGAIALLAAMTAPLAGGLLAYHIYLIWHGMTTNESFKWEEWAEDVQDGYVYRCTDAQHPRPEPGHLQYGPTVASADDSSSAHKGDADGAEAQNGEPQMTEESLRQAISKYSLEELEPRSTWPIPPGQRLVSRANKMSLEAELLPGTVLGAEPWLKVESMEEVINIYDLGFWRNLKDALGVRAGH